MSINIGDTVRFLNTTGGGIVKGFQNKQVVVVEDENGFDFPILISECVVVQTAGNEKMIQSVSSDAIESIEQKIRIEPSDRNSNDETPEGEKITACLAYLPLDYKNLSSSSYECYFVNDSNYILFFNYMSCENGMWRTRHHGAIEPHTKLFIEEFDKSQLNEIERVSVQFIAFKQDKEFVFKQPCSVDIRIDTVKFYKLHSFRDNDYFEDDALVYYLMKRDKPEGRLPVSAEELTKAMLEKNMPERRPREEKIVKKSQPDIVEIDLHINQLLDTTAGMSAGDMLQYQMSKFHEAMEKYKKNKKQRIVFIHGKGDGVLKSEIIKELKGKYKDTSNHQDASFKEYGFGATMVTIR